MLFFCDKVLCVFVCICLSGKKHKTLKYIYYCWKIMAFIHYLFIFFNHLSHVVTLSSGMHKFWAVLINHNFHVMDNN